MRFSQLNMKKESVTHIKVFKVLFFGIFIFLLVGLVITNKRNNLKAHCAKAVCNEDNTICYNYSVNKDGNTIKIWEGNCSHK